ncbi:MAG: hypothetical protein NW223_24210 [Hyphomicrobiaceae bacterium]|nr:hypothetical protein [Hyphomicrobiaceae bacterium]
MSGEPVRRVVVSGLLALRRSLRLAAVGLRWVLQILLALLILLEEWGWRPLAAGLAYLARWRPLAALETAIARLPPYAALVAFALPSLVLLPLKFLALLLIGKGYFMTSVALFLAAKAVATALVARLFILTQPALMSIGWFAWTYDRVMPWKEALTEMVRASAVWRWGRAFKRRVRRMLAPYWLAIKPDVVALAQRLLARIRARLGGPKAPSQG